MRKHFPQRPANIRNAKYRKGAYSVEFAICATVMFMTIFASFELARYLFVRQGIDQAAYEAARTGIVEGATASDVYAKANQLLGVQGIVVSNVTVTPATITQTTTQVTVSITCNYAANTWVPPSFLPGNSIVTTTTLDHENQAFLVPEAARVSATSLNNPQPNDV